MSPQKDPQEITQLEGLNGPGKALYVAYRKYWKAYEHPLPEWEKLEWQAHHVWNLVAAALTQERLEERERCAKLAENYSGNYFVSGNIAARIRSQE